MIKRILIGAWIAALLIGATAVAGEWVNRSHDAQAKGFSGWQEMRSAYLAGHSDPDTYRAAMRELEKRQIEKAEATRRASEARKAAEERQSEPQLACFAAQMTIKERLASPAAARFPSCLDYPGHVGALSADKWIVRSWVELPDSFGVYRQLGYEMTVEHDRSARQYRTFILTMPR